jgi:hypothetical protein
MAEEIAAVIQRFRGAEKDRAEIVHPLVRDPVLRNLIVIWPMIPVTCSAPRTPVPEAENEQWFWLWENVKYDHARLADFLKVDRAKLSRLIDRAIAFRLIYPDGTANSMAVQFVKQDIAKSLSKKGHQA